MVHTNILCAVVPWLPQSRDLLEQWSKRADMKVSIDLLGSSSAESDPVITRHISRLRTPRARAMEPTRDPNFRRGVQVAPLRALQPRARERPTGAGEKRANIRKKTHWYIVIRTRYYVTKYTECCCSCCCCCCCVLLYCCCCSCCCCCCSSSYTCHPRLYFIKAYRSTCQTFLSQTNIHPLAVQSVL